MCGFDKRNAARVNQEGVALITALALLVVFSLMGAAYLGYMLSDRNAVAASVSKSRAQHAAEAGIYAAIGDLQRVVDSNGDVPTKLDYQFPIYQTEWTDAESIEESYVAALSPRDDANYAATVAIADENARININFAPRGMLERILNVDRATARRITSELPRAGEAADPSKRWFTSVDDLVTRGYLNPQDFEQLDASLLTVYTGDDLTLPREYINLNTAPAPVVAAVLNVPDDRALAIAQGPPLRNLDDLVSAAGQDASAFNTVNELSGALPGELTLQSRTFRLASQARLTGGDETIAASIVAVVHFPVDGRPEIRYWTTEIADAPVATSENEVEAAEPADLPDTSEEPDAETSGADSDETVI